MPGKKPVPKKVEMGLTDGNELTEDQKQKLTEAGVDWKKMFDRFKNVLPLILALVDTLLNDGRIPMGAEVGHSHDVKSNLQNILNQQLCAAHCLAHQITELPCDDEHSHDEENVV